MTYLLDTNACIAVMNGRPPHVRERFRRERRHSQPAFVSSITLFELWFGIAKSMRQDSNARQLLDFVPAVEILPFDDEDARVTGHIRLALMRKGTSIGSYDLLIAGQAICRNLIVVTADFREFSYVPDLRWENWQS